MGITDSSSQRRCHCLALVTPPHSSLASLKKRTKQVKTRRIGEDNEQESKKTTNKSRVKRQGADVSACASGSPSRRELLRRDLRGPLLSRGASPLSRRTLLTCCPLAPETHAKRNGEETNKQNARERGRMNATFKLRAFNRILDAAVRSVS